MEPKFINQYEIPFERFQQWAKHPIGKRAVHTYKIGSALRVILALCGIMLMILSVICRIFDFFLFGFLFLFFAWYRQFARPSKILKSQYQMVLRSINSDSWMRTITFSENICCRDNNQTAQYGYADIIKVLEDETCFYLFYNEDMVIRVYKDGFTLGTPESFKEFCDSYILLQNK